MRLPPHRNQKVVQLIRDQGWEALVTSTHAEELQQHCCLCARWIVDPSALKRHIAKAHKKLWEQVSGRLEAPARSALVPIWRPKNNYLGALPKMVDFLISR